MMRQANMRPTRSGQDMIVPAKVTCRPNRRERRRLRAFCQEQSGIAATEFALIVPIMIMMYFGMIELTQALGHDRKAVLLARSLADITSQSMGISNGDMNTIFMAASATMSPYAADRLAMRVTSIMIDGIGNAYVDWSDVKNINPGTAFTPYGRCRISNDLVPAPLRAKRSWLVLSEVRVQHIPTFGKFVAPGGVEMSESLPMRPRVSTSILREGVSTDPCPGSAP